MVQRAAWWMCCGIEYETPIGDFLVKLSPPIRVESKSRDSAAVKRDTWSWICKCSLKWLALDVRSYGPQIAGVVKHAMNQPYRLLE